MPSFTFNHNNINVFDLEKSVAFYKDALGLQELRRYKEPSGAFELVFLGDNATTHRLELTWLKERTEPYNLGDNEMHLAFTVDNYDEAHAMHAEMGCICYENPTMGLYFIEDPDGYWLEILPKKK